MKTFYFYDLETSGLNPREQRIMQFAGQRTDMDLNPISERHNIFIKLTADVLPEPEAVLITGITPQKTLEEGITEAEFLQIFHKEIATPDTIFVGYNTVRFDDEFIRYLHYRNFYDAYEWQWSEGRGKWDLLDVVRMTRALRPDGIEWPVGDNGKATVRLEVMTAANNIEHEGAHEALSDVKACIALAKLIKTLQPKLFQFLLTLRDKKAIQKLVEEGKPLVYTSGKYPAEYEKTTVAVMAARNKDRGALMYDLRIDPTPYLKMSAEELYKQWKVKTKDESAERLPLKTLQYNHCPAIAPLSVLDEASQQRIKIDMNEVAKNLKKLKSDATFADKLTEMLQIADKVQEEQRKQYTEGQTVDQQLYSGFFDNEDKTSMRVVRAATLAELKKLQLPFKDSRLEELLPLYKARNFPESQTSVDKKYWEEYRRTKLMSGDDKSRAARYFIRIADISERDDLTKREQSLLIDLDLYGQSIVPDSL